MISYNDKYCSRVNVEFLDYDSLRNKMKDKINDHLSTGEEILLFIYDLKDIRSSHGANWFLHEYDVSFLTNYGNIVTATSKYNNYPEVDKIDKKELINRPLSDHMINKLKNHNWVHDYDTAENMIDSVHEIIMSCR